nr:atherin-like [Desmodus rotundus]
MSPEPLRCPPAPGSPRIPAAGPARYSRGDQEASALAAGPRRNSRLSLPSSPQWSEPSSALRHEREREGNQARRAPENARGRRGRVSRTRPQPQAPPSPQPHSRVGGRPQGTSRGFRETTLPDSPQTARKGKARRLHLLISHLPRESSLSTSQHARQGQWALQGEKATSASAGYEISHKVLEQE